MSLLIGLYNETRLHVKDFDKDEHKNNVFCFACNSSLIGKKGMIKIHHYSHVKNSGCVIDRERDSRGVWNIMWQNIAQTQFIEKYINYNGEIHIADIINENNLVIEVKDSNLSQAKINYRENFYNNMIWILNGNDIVINPNQEDEYLCIKYNILFTTTNNYNIVKITKKLWTLIKKKAYIDIGYQMLEIIKHLDNYYCICKTIPYPDFLSLYYQNILISSISDTTDIILSHNKPKRDKYIIKKIPDYMITPPSTKKNIIYCEKNNTFTGPGTYDLRGLLYKIGYRFNKVSKHWALE